MNQWAKGIIVKSIGRKVKVQPQLSDSSLLCLSSVKPASAVSSYTFCLLPFNSLGHWTKQLMLLPTFIQNTHLFPVALFFSPDTSPPLLILFSHCPLSNFLFWPHINGYCPVFYLGCHSSHTTLPWDWKAICSKLKYPWLFRPSKLPRLPQLLFSP